MLRSNFTEISHAKKFSGKRIKNSLLPRPMSRIWLLKVTAATSCSIFRAFLKCESFFSLYCRFFFPRLGSFAFAIVTSSHDAKALFLTVIGSVLGESLHYYALYYAKCFSFFFSLLENLLLPGTKIGPGDSNNIIRGG